LAHAAQKTGIPAHIVMPSNALKPKRAAVLTYGGHVYECEPTQQSRENVANKVQQETGAVMIPPYDYDPVIAGQGTVALEILGDAPQIDTIIVPCGGGGLLSGVAIAAKALNPNVKVYGAEPAAADDAYQSVRNGVRTPLPDGVTPKTIADGLRTTIGHRNWSIIKQRELVHDIVTVSEEEIVFAMRTVWERMKIIIEPSSAVAVAAALKPQIRDEGGRHVAIVISGGNVDLDQLPW
jgi:threonine dehydratase